MHGESVGLDFRPASGSALIHPVPTLLLVVQAAVQLAQTGQGVSANPQIERLALSWRAGLLSGDASVENEIYSLPQEWDTDYQQIRQLVRTCISVGTCPSLHTVCALLEALFARSGPEPSRMVDPWPRSRVLPRMCHICC